MSRRLQLQLAAAPCRIRVKGNRCPYCAARFACVHELLDHLPTHSGARAEHHMGRPIGGLGRVRRWRDAHHRDLEPVEEVNAYAD